MILIITNTIINIIDIDTFFNVFELNAFLFYFQSEIIHEREMRCKPTQSGGNDAQDDPFGDDVNVLQVVSISFD